MQQGGEVPTEVGFCWNTSPNPTPSNNKIVSTLRTDSSMIDEIFNLKPGTTYYVRAYAINSRGIG
ncbi:MAG: fibronectin type III domain-containing protein, partial [Sphingobacteriales bacterium]